MAKPTTVDPLDAFASCSRILATLDEPDQRRVVKLLGDFVGQSAAPVGDATVNDPPPNRPSPRPVGPQLQTSR